MDSFLFLGSQHLKTVGKKMPSLSKTLIKTNDIHLLFASGDQGVRGEKRGLGKKGPGKKGPR